MIINRIQITHHDLRLETPFIPAWDNRSRKVFQVSIVRVTTDEGHVGIGSGDVMAGFEPYVDLFLGQDPLNLERHYKVIDNISFHAGRCWPLDIALWDLAGKIKGKPVYQLLGGATDRIKAYASLGTMGNKAETIEKVMRFKEEGFKAAKIHFGRPTIEEDIEIVTELRKAVGDQMDLIVDCNQGWRMPWDTRPFWELHKAVKAANVLKELEVRWMEEPLHRGDYSGMSALRAMTGFTLAGGEMTREPHEFHEIIERDCLDIITPDAALTCGISGLAKIAGVARAEGVIFTPHTWGNGIGLLANLHLTAGTVGAPMIEFPYDPPYWIPEVRDFMLKDKLHISTEGELVLSNEPGLGFALEEERLNATLAGTVL